MDSARDHDLTASGMTDSRSNDPKILAMCRQALATWYAAQHEPLAQEDQPPTQQTPAKSPG